MHSDPLSRITEVSIVLPPFLSKTLVSFKRTSQLAGGLSTYIASLVVLSRTEFAASV